MRTKGARKHADGLAGTHDFSDSFHALYELGKVKTLLEHKAYSAIAAPADVKRWQAKARCKGKARSFFCSLGLRRAEAASRIALFDDVCSRPGWLRDDILTFNGLILAQRGELLDWVVMEIQSSAEHGRVGKSPAELCCRRAHPHWQEVLGYQRFSRN